ncbi:coiled-coil domain-containing protein 112-like [Trichoplusia ni]|uniref:Coiled-coil domain-containing protein 112-like n=2 Tax=Trichoplusia ni TaxID=7111 RepID=A0A7E5VP11_TRINI|nr:coiled-coil domain-containing protein 112-like [Trichoplusia ni]
MDLTSIKSSSYTNTENSHTVSISAKLRRLKIEESLLLQSINKCVREFPSTDSDNDSTTSFSDFSGFSAKIKESLRQITLTFQDIKTSTSSKEILKSIDIDDVKRSTLDLENNMRNLKLLLQSELTSLKSAEKQLNQSINENPIAISRLKRHPKIPTAKYNEIVPSPVKTLMNSPFKCLEVQEFQEFMMNSPNRYGGWAEYHHNIFVNYWQKYFNLENINDEQSESCIESSPFYHLFLRDLQSKLQDISEKEITSHVRWYTKLVYLKERQQKAIDKWRSNRRAMKSKVKPDEKNNFSLKFNSSDRKDRCTASEKDSLDERTKKELSLQAPTQNEVCCFVRQCFSDELKKIDKLQENVSNEQSTVGNGKPVMKRFQKSTKQWNIRLNTKTIKTDVNCNNVESIKKLHTPTWRVGL